MTVIYRGRVNQEKKAFIINLESLIIATNSHSSVSSHKTMGGHNYQKCQIHFIGEDIWEPVWLVFSQGFRKLSRNIV